MVTNHLVKLHRGDAWIQDQLWSRDWIQFDVQDPDRGRKPYEDRQAPF